MRLKFQNKRIAGIVSVLPETEVSFDEEAQNYDFPVRQTLRLKKIMGYKQHRIAKEKTTPSDLGAYGLKWLLDEGLLRKEEIEALVVVTSTPDHFIPHVSNIIQGKCNLSDNVLCMDIAQGCVGFIIGLMQCFMILDKIKGKVVLVNADVLSHKVSKKDRNSYPLIGDAATVTVLENSLSKDIFLNMKMDGSRGNVLCIPAGGTKIPCTADTAKLQADSEGNLRSLDNLCMDGSSVFEYVQHDAPPVILEAFKIAKVNPDDIDWFLFHQPNRFMLRKLAEKLDVPYNKVPMNIVENFGNPSGASIPLCITYNLANKMKNEKQQLCCLSAFGSGLACGAMIIELGGMDFCEIKYSDL